MSENLNKFAYVSYVGTNERDIVPISNIKHFEFNKHEPKKKYKIKWNNNWYYGSLSFFGESEEQVRDLAEMARPKIISDHLLVSNSESDEPARSNKRKVENKGNERLLQKKLRKLTDKYNTEEMTSDFIEMEQSQECEKNQEKSDNENDTHILVTDNCYAEGLSAASNFNEIEGSQDSERKQEKSDNENDTHTVLVMNNCSAERLSAASIFNETEGSQDGERKEKNSNRGHIQTTLKQVTADKCSAEKPKNIDILAKIKLENNKLRNKNEELRNKNEELVHTNEELKHMLKDSQVLNIELQKQVINVVGEMQVQLSRLTNREVSMPRDDEQLGYAPTGFVRSSDNFVHIGRDVWLKHEIYDTIIFTSSTPSLFVKQMAVSVFGGRILKNSSVTGRISNRNINKEECRPQPKPKLDPTKLLAIEDIFRHWLKEHKKYNSVQINAHVNKLPSYISKKISQMNACTKKTPKRKVNIDMNSNCDKENRRATVADVGKMENAIASSDSDVNNNADYTDTD